MAAQQQPTPQTLRLKDMIEDIEEEGNIIQYLTQNRNRINVNYVQDDLSLVREVVLVALVRVAAKLIEFGASIEGLIIHDFLDGQENVDRPLFGPPAVRAKTTMNTFLNAGFSREDMMIIVCLGGATGTNKELLADILVNKGPGFNVNHTFEGQTAMHILADAYDAEQRGIFMQMLRLLRESGGDPNIRDDRGQSVIDMVNQNVENPRPVLAILNAPPIPDAALADAPVIFFGMPPIIPPAPVAPPAAPVAPPAAPVAPVAPAAVSAAAAANYKKLFADELRKPSPDIAKLEEYKRLGNINVNTNFINGKYPLAILLDKKPNMKVIEAILKMGANPNKIDDNGYPIFWKMFERSIKDQKELLLLLIKYGADVKINVKSRSVIGAFIIKYIEQNSSWEIKHQEIVKILIQNGADIHYIPPGPDGLDILDFCMSYNKTDASKYFIQKGSTLLLNAKTRIYKHLLLIPEGYVFSDDYYFKKIVNILNFLLPYGINHNLYFRDFLDAALAKPRVSVYKIIYPELQKNLRINYNEVYADGATPLIKAVQLCTKNPQPWIKQMIEDFLAKGADPKYTDLTGKKAIDYTTNEDLKELLGEQVFKILWTGFSKADIDFTNNVFHQVMHASNLAIKNPDESLFSICPVCLKHIQHEPGTCMYMTHSCEEQAEFKGYYHKKLWNAFSYAKEYDNLGRIIPAAQQKKVVEWCTLCGRICKGHKHYTLAPVFKADGSIQIPRLIDGGDYFATDCAKPTVGGGGIREKINRYRRFREVVLGLNKPDKINNLTFEKAINTLVEAVWVAPLDPRNFEIDTIQTNKAYNALVANTRFPIPSNLPKPPKYIYSDPAYPNIGNLELLPLVYSKATNTYKNSAYSVFGDDENIVQFRHRMANGQINTHAGPNQQVALDRLMGYIQLQCESPESENFGMCWQNGKEGYTMVNDKEHMPPKCTARLYPDELLHTINQATYSDEVTKAHHMNIYGYYKKLFADKFGEPIGIAPPNNNSNNNANKYNASNSKGSNSNQEGGKRWSTRKRKHSKRKLKTRRT